MRSTRSAEFSPYEQKMQQRMRVSQVTSSHSPIPNSDGVKHAWIANRQEVTNHTHSRTELRTVEQIREASTVPLTVPGTSILNGLGFNQILKSLMNSCNTQTPMSHVNQTIRSTIRYYHLQEALFLEQKTNN